MPRCATCGGEIPEAGRYCPNCGTRADASKAPSDFEIGKIAALASIKGDILKWFGGWGAGIAAVGAILGYFGMHEFIKSTVTENVKSELKQDRDEIVKSRKDLFIDAGKAISNQEEIAKILAETKTKLLK